MTGHLYPESMTRDIASRRSMAFVRKVLMSLAKGGRVRRPSACDDREAAYGIIREGGKYSTVDQS